MADTIRETNIAALKTALDGFSWTVFGFEEEDPPSSPIQPSVYRGLIVFDPDTTPPPLVAIVPKPELSSRTKYGSTLNRMPVDVSAVVALSTVSPSADNPSEKGEEVFGELVEAIFSSSWSTEVSDVTYDGGGIDSYPDRKNSEILVVGASITIEYETNIGDPYNLT
jgi:hypothetical protein